MSGVCKIEIPNYRGGNPDELVVCGEPKVERSAYCYWHRIHRTSMNDQIKNAEFRVLHPEEHPDSKDDIPPGMKWCVKCAHVIPIWYFNKGAGRCRACQSIDRRAQKDARTYGLSPEQRIALNKKQRGKCAICGKAQNMRALAVDHNHQSGAVRGLLCKRCNHDILGSAYDDPKVLLSAAAYLLGPVTSERWIPPARLMPAMLAFNKALIDLAEEIRNGN